MRTALTLRDALSLLPALLLLLAAGRVLFARLLEDRLGAGGAIAYSWLLGATAVVLLYLPGMALGRPGLVWAAGLGAIAAGALRRGLLLRFAAELGRDGPRLAAFLGVGVAVTALAHGRQVSFEGGGVAWRGTLGRDLMFYLSCTHSLLREFPPHLLGTGGEAPFTYHAFSMILDGAAARLSAASLSGVYFRLLPPLMLAMAFESHRLLLRRWFPASRALALAALAPLFAMDLDPWLRAIGIAPSDLFENRTGTTMLVSPSFLAGQTVSCLVLAAFLHVLGTPGSLRTSRRTAIVLGALAGSVVGWKLPSFALLAVGLAVLLPRALRQEGARRAGLVAGAMAATALAVYLVSFQWPLLAGGEARPAATVGLVAFPGFRAGGLPAEGVLGVFGLLALYLAQAAGPRLLRLRELAGRARTDPGTLAVLAMFAAGVVLPLLVGTESGTQEKYFRRCGGYFVLLVTAALVLRDVATPGRRRRGLLDLAVLGVFSGGAFAYLLGSAPMDARLGAADVAALHSLDDARQRILVSPGARDRYGYAITGLSGQRVWRESGLYLGSPDLDLDEAGFADLSARPPFDTFLLLRGEKARYPILAGPGFEEVASGPGLEVVRRVDR